MAAISDLLSNPQFVTLLVGFLYAIIGYFEAVRSGSEQFDVVKFGKTVVTFALSAGFVSPTTATGYNTLLESVGSVTGLAFVIDQITSKLLSAHRAGGPVPPTTPAPVASS